MASDPPPPAKHNCPSDPCGKFFWIRAGIPPPFPSLTVYGYKQCLRSLSCIIRV